MDKGKQHDAEQAERRRKLEEWRAQRELEKKRELEAKSSLKRCFHPPFVVRKPENHNLKPAESVFRTDAISSSLKSGASSQAPSPIRHNPHHKLDSQTKKIVCVPIQPRPVKRTQSLSSVKAKIEKDAVKKTVSYAVRPIHSTTASKSAPANRPTASRTTGNEHTEPRLKKFLSADHLGSGVQLAAGSRWASLDTMFGNTSASEAARELNQLIPRKELYQFDTRDEISENVPDLLPAQGETFVEVISDVNASIEDKEPNNMVGLEHVTEGAEVVRQIARVNFDSEFLGAQFRECPLSFYLHQPLTVRVVDPSSGDFVMEYNVEMPSIAIFTAADAIKCGEEGDIDLARAIFEIISVDVSKKGDQKVSTTILFSGVTRRWHAYPEAACPRFWITWANWEEDKGNPMGALTVCETAMGKFTDKEDIELIYATVKRIFESIDNDAGDPIVDDNFREEEQLMGQQKEQDNSITETAVENPIQTPRNTTFQKTWRPSLNSQNGDPFDDTPEPVFGRLFGKPVRGTPHPGHGGNDSLAKIMNDVSLEDDDSDALDPAETQTESDDEHHSHKKASLDQNDNDCDVFLASAQKTSRDRRKSPVNRRKSEMSKKVRVGVRVDEDSEETTGSRVTVLTPRKARKNERESLGVSEIITPVRRSRRLFDESMYVPTQAEALEIMENLEKPYKFECDASVRNRDDKENEQSLFGHQGEKVSKLLENYGYAYAPNKMLEPVTLPKSERKHK